ncbi:MAG: phosphoglycerate dehydrogenase [Caulobacteraceae bacterium]|nr:phosphoglycerate dehydrogenase [Caulobacteraceae bacterium]
MSAPAFIVDFDSTFTRVEALEVLAELALADHPEREAAQAEVRRLTDLAMGGEIGFGEALRRRIELLRPRREHFAPLVERLRGEVSASIRRNRDFFERNAGRIWLVTGGFHDYVDDIAAEYGLRPDHVLANRLTWDADGTAVGLDAANPLSRDGGKVEAVRGLQLSGPVVVVGDGWTDYEIRQAGAADRFHAFTENVARPRVVAAADQVSASWDEVLHAEGLAGRWSYPRSRMKVLLLENVHPDAARRFRDEGYDVAIEPGAVSEVELAGRLKDVSILGIRSKTQVTAAALAGAERLLAVGAYCIGVNQIDLAACADRGVAAFNAPYSNTRSVVELAIGEIVALMRRLTDRTAEAHAGRWAKTADGAREIRGKTLGIVGYGAIGSQLSVLAEALGMTVVYHDIAEKLAYGAARRARSLGELLAQADVVSLHVDGRAGNRHLIGAGELALMKPGALLLNLSRGHVVDVEALAAALRAGRLGGAGVDVFPEEPAANGEPFDTPLRGLPNVILTPHVGGSTEEAQAAIADFATERLLGFLHRGDTTFCVNLPNVQLSEVSGGHRLLHIHRNRPGVLAGINRVLAEHGLNILAQHLKTDDRMGYVITDVDHDYPQAVSAALKALPETVRFRVLR